MNSAIVLVKLPFGDWLGLTVRLHTVYLAFAVPNQSGVQDRVVCIDGEVIVFFQV